MVETFNPGRISDGKSTFSTLQRVELVETECRRRKLAGIGSFSTLQRVELVETNHSGNRSGITAALSVPSNGSNWLKRRGIADILANFGPFSTLQRVELVETSGTDIKNQITEAFSTLQRVELVETK